MAIRDQSRYRKMRAEIIGYRAVRRLLPLGYLLGPRAWKVVREAKRAVDENLPFVEEQLDRFTELPDQFNEKFGPEGWIATDELDLDTMEEALMAAKSGGVAKGEDYIESHYNDGLTDYVDGLLVLGTLAPRRELIRLAVTDHCAGRYHASVPVVLTQIDGVCFDLTNKSFYVKHKRAAGHLVAHETTVGDQGGLSRLAHSISKGRGSTRQAVISRPYRDGILHGRELGYANKRTSTKALAALFGLKSWIRAVEKGEQFKPPEEFVDPETATWEDLKREFRGLVRGARELSESRRRAREEGN